MPKLLHLTTTSISLRLLLMPQLEAFANSGYEVILASGEDEYTEGIQEFPLQVLETYTRSNDVKSDMKALLETRNLLKKIQPDILHTHNPKPGVFGRVSSGKDLKVVNTVHGLYAQKTDPISKRALVYGVEKIAESFSDHELVQSKEDYETLLSLGYKEETTTHLGNGIDLDRFILSDEKYKKARRDFRLWQGWREDHIVVGTCGRLVKEKGYRELFDYVRTAKPNVKFLVLGQREPGKKDGVSEYEIEKMADLGVVFIETSEPEIYYPAMDIYVSPTHREGYPRAMMEACAAKLPVVTTRIRGCVEVVTHLENGLLFPVKSVTDMTKSINLLIDYPDLAKKLGNNSRVKAKKDFNQESVISKTLNVYSSLLGSTT